MWDFEHPPLAAKLAERYTLHYTKPALCADELLAARADLGLIPIAELTPDLAIVPGCTIAADTASRSSLAYAKILFRKFLGTQPTFIQHPADPIAMLQQNDAALLIGDPALLALESRSEIEQAVGPCQWIDLAHEWHTRTGLPWVAAVWAVRPEALSRSHITAAQLTEDLTTSRDHGLVHIEDLVEQWTPRLPVPSETIRHYLTGNIHYILTPDCIQAMELFRRYAAEIDALPPLPTLRFL